MSPKPRGHFSVILKHFDFLFRLTYESSFQEGGDGVTEQEFEQHIRTQRATVFRLAYSMMKNREDADDITQDAFVRLYQSHERFRTEDNLKAWLIRVTINLCKDLLRSAWRRHKSDDMTEKVCESREELHLLDSVKKLKPESGAVVYLYYYEGYSVEEIARLRRTTSAAVRTRLTRARKELKTMLSEEDDL